MGNVTNTAREEVNPQWTMGGNPGAIEAQEARGQGELVNSQVLPTDGLLSGRRGEKVTIADIIKDAGGSIGEPVEGDPVFTNVVLPKGWFKEAAPDHSMWSYLRDEKGGKRAGIFYKAAFYDRSAHISLTCRFGIDVYSHDVEGEYKASLTDERGDVEFSTEIRVESDEDKGYEVREAVRGEVNEFLAENYPEWESAGAYWD